MAERAYVLQFQSGVLVMLLKEKAELPSFLKTAAQERPFKSNPLPLIPRACKSLSLTLDFVCQWGSIGLL